MPNRPEDLFRAEKQRASTSTTSQHARLLAEAKAAFDKLMAEGQAARKSGRPRKHPLPPLKTSSARPVEKPQVLTGGITPPPRMPAPTPAPAAKPAKPAAVVAKPKAKSAAKKSGKSGARTKSKAKAKRPKR